MDRIELDQSQAQIATEAAIVRTSTFFVVALTLVASCTYSVFELATNIAASFRISEWDSLLIVVKSGGRVACWSLVGLDVGTMLIVLNIVNRAIGMTLGRVSRGVINQLLKTPANLALLILCFLLSSVIYAEYIYVPIVNPLSGNIITDGISAVSAFMLIFIRKF